MNKYSTWTYLSLLAVLILGILYALPNVFGDAPSIQISASSPTVKISQETLQKVEGSLKQADIDYVHAKLNTESSPVIAIRFKQTDAQLQAKEILKDTLGTDYTVALSLVPNTPAWLSAVGAQPMKLGLDLRGGVHFLLAIDIDTALDKRQKDLVRSMGDELRNERIRYQGLKANKDGSVVVRFKNQEQLDQGTSILRRQFQSLQFTKDTERDFKVVGTMPAAALEQMRQDIVEQMMTVLRNRVNELGVAEPIVQQQGREHIVVDLPGVQDAAQAKQILGSTATVEFHLQDDEHEVNQALNGVVPFGSKIYRDLENRPYLLKTQIVLDGKSITNATAGTDQQTSRPAVFITVSGPEVSYFNRVTGDNVGKAMATLYIETKNETKQVKGETVATQKKVERVINIATINQALGYNFQITGMERQASQDLALILRSGAMPTNFYVAEESVVGPSLGQDNIDKGLLSITVGFCLIVFFMAVYYRLFGIFANVALFVNLILLTAILSILGGTLTLPAIAGIVLTMGMAVDANVLIFERIREEIRNGMSPQASIHAGFDRAFSTIVDANLTTLIAAAALFALGSGAVKGFAVTLTIGLLTSMLTAITGTRAMVNLTYGGRTVKKLSIGI